MSATDVARNFSSVINRVGAGEEVEIVRNGAAVAELRAPAQPRSLSGAAWRDLMERLPDVDEDFARDLESARASIAAPAGKWPR